MTARPTPRRGFTLLEMMVVIVVMTILASLLLPRMLGGGRREFRRLGEQVEDLLTMFAQREQLQRQPVGLRYDEERHALELVLLERDADADVTTSAWRRDPFVAPVQLSPDVEILDVQADGEPIDIVDFPFSTTSSESRPTLVLVLAGDEGDVTITLPGTAIVPESTWGAGGGVPATRWETTDLDAAGRSREQW